MFSANSDNLITLLNVSKNQISVYLMLIIILNYLLIFWGVGTVWGQFLIVKSLKSFSQMLLATTVYLNCVITFA